MLLDVLGNRFLCSCEGEEVRLTIVLFRNAVMHIFSTLQLLINITTSGFRHQGSLICPSCSQICYVRWLYFNNSVCVISIQPLFLSYKYRMKLKIACLQVRIHTYIRNMYYTATVIFIYLACHCECYMHICLEVIVHSYSGCLEDALHKVFPVHE